MNYSGKHNSNQNGRILTLLALLAVLAFPASVASVSGQTAQQPTATPDPQQGGGDPIRQLNLTAEQREQVRSIRQSNQAERIAITDRLREANRLLEESLNSENPDEAVIEERVRDVAAAQSAVMRMRVLTEVRIRRVLTPEQRIVLRSLQRQARDTQRERLENRAEKQERREERRGLQNQRNGLRPLLPRNQRQLRP
jgi:Spy/CpxP family protein refolding chaperone